jgi:hypothetical protein
VINGLNRCTIMALTNDIALDRLSCRPITYKMASFAIQQIFQIKVLVAANGEFGWGYPERLSWHCSVLICDGPCQFWIKHGGSEMVFLQRLQY